MHLSGQSSGGAISAAVSFAQRFDGQSPEDLEFIMSLFERVAETERHIDMNIAVPRCLEGLCHDLGQKLRPAGR